MCTLEAGFTCTATFPTVCTEICDGDDKGKGLNYNMIIGFLTCDNGASNTTCCDNCNSVWTGCTCTRGAGCSE